MASRQEEKEVGDLTGLSRVELIELIIELQKENFTLQHHLQKSNVLLKVIYLSIYLSSFFFLILFCVFDFDVRFCLCFQYFDFLCIIFFFFGLTKTNNSNKLMILIKKEGNGRKL